MRNFCFSLTLVLVFVTIASCTPLTSANTEPAGKAAANSLLVQQGILRAVQDPRRPGSTILVFGPALMSQTQLVKSKQICEGSVGSVIPPLVLDDALTLL